jgi:hypothetical protein
MKNIEKTNHSFKRERSMAWSLVGFELSIIKLWVSCCTDVLLSPATKKLFKIQSFQKNEKHWKTNHDFKREK